MQTKTSLIALIVIALSLAFTAPSHARGGATVEGTIQTLDLKTKHATLLTKKGKTISFYWKETTTFVNANPLRKGASVTVKYHEVLIGENYVSRIEAGLRISK